LGNGIYGVERASRYYFGVGVDDLSIGQIATLVGMTRSPEYYEPRRHPERAEAVRNVVLGLMRADALVDEVDVAAAKESDLGV
ncbi:MAG: penicillin-binding protein 1B, partial [Actinobacteria bacterium]|nr:penicillin-binding protein 1B [Actinomycetota bacterium]